MNVNKLKDDAVPSRALLPTTIETRSSEILTEINQSRSTPKTLDAPLAFTFMFIDLIFNCVSLFPRSRDGLLVLFIFQDLFLVLSITTMLMTFFSTYLFQAGLVEVLVRKFASAGAVCGLYAAASVALHAAWLLARWPDPHAASPPALVLLFTLQRCLSPWYYFYYKRAALRVSDPRFYDDIDWIDAQLRPTTH